MRRNNQKFCIPMRRTCPAAIAAVMAWPRTRNAQRMRSFTAGCGKAACTRNIVYRFTPHGQNQSVEGRLSLSTSHHDHEEYDYVMATNNVPILYDPRDPSRAMFFWRDQIANRASPRKMWDFILIINLIFAAAATPLGLMMAWSIRRQRAKARAAKATPA
ncbi:MULTISPECIES: hypothetical protein [Sphingomonas]|jgi:hypothetical protein|uniref:DUF3592 domain-containing protein n=2 Tax=Sphingomonas zeae TaxID=1646122 RepID=A0A7Y6B8B7_9SPHN|nr:MULTISPECIES: hypothetical protein [Sphingomonas]MBB4047199.1 hypothetical protein [Sphingomonas zeae]MDK8186338.1 hypothetical protein [Sphingomonas zeae]MDK8216041.1 hypothetical protein [Sphingomonas sp. UMB7805-LC452B]NUU48347.1 hypothetical protein [Sphingomonas zeae]